MTVLMVRGTPGTADWICCKSKISMWAQQQRADSEKHCNIQPGMAMFVLGNLGYLWLIQCPSG